MSSTSMAIEPGQEKIHNNSPPESNNSLENGPKPWDASTEKRNPRNWPVWSKVFHTAIPCLFSFELTISTSILEPAASTFMQEFSISHTVSLLPLTLYTLGLAFGPLFIAPLSEVWGRKMIYLSSLSLFLAFTGGAAAAENFATLLVCRFLSGFLGSAGIAIGGGSVVEIWGFGKPSGIATMCFILGPFLGPTLGPLVGAYIIADHGGDWRWALYLIIMMAAPIWVATVLMKETSKGWILRKEDKGRAEKTVASSSSFVTKAVFRPTKMLFTSVAVLSLTLYTAYAYAMVFSYFASNSYILTTLYGFDVKQVGLSFIAVIIGYLLAGVVFVLIDKAVQTKAQGKSGPDWEPVPETRLIAAMIGSIFIPISLFWYAWEAHRDGNWAALVTSGIPLGFGSFTLFLSAITYMVQIFRAEEAASGKSLSHLQMHERALLTATALAANGSLRYTLGAVFPLFTIQMYENLGVHWAGSVFAFCSVFLLPIPWLLYRYGPRLRGERKQIDDVSPE